MSLPKVGFWWSEKKAQKLSVTEFAAHFLSAGYELVKIDLEAPLDAQGPFEAIVHKLSDVVVKAQQGDGKAAKEVKAFEAYMAKHKDIVILDPLENVDKLLDRYRQYKLIEDSELAREDGVFTPSFVELTTTDVAANLAKMRDAGVRFPFVCKPLLAHGSTFAHQMSLIFSEQGLKDINPPCVAQTFINHNARLFKLFVIKDKYYVIERPSLKNFGAGNYQTVYFDSHDISKPKSSSALTELDEVDQSRYPVREPEKKRLDRIVSVVSDNLGLALLGIDVIIENETGRYAIIDMNSFPGYDGVDNFLEMLRDLVVSEIKRNRELRQGRPVKEVKSFGTIADIQRQPPCLSLSCDAVLTRSTINPTKYASCDFKMPLTTTIATTIASLGIVSSADSAVMIQNGNDIDSGIDTSDSCDEKKNKKQAQVKAVRRQHSRSFTALNSSSSSPKIGDFANDI